jgi:hypothetical protein
MSFFGRLSIKSVVDKATVDDQIATPGFLYNEINSVRAGEWRERD